MALRLPTKKVTRDSDTTFKVKRSKVKCVYPQAAATVSVETY